VPEVLGDLNHRDYGIPGDQRVLDVVFNLVVGRLETAPPLPSRVYRPPPRVASVPKPRVLSWGQCAAGHCAAIVGASGQKVESAYAASSTEVSALSFSPDTVDSLMPKMMMSGRR
jgi:hypothetical protein